MHPPMRIPFRHLLVQDAAAGRHPLHVAGAEAAAIAQAVAVIHRACEHVRDGLDAAVRMPWETREIVRRVFVPEVVEEQKGIEFGGVAEPERPLQLDAGAFQRWPRLEDLFDWSNRHLLLLYPTAKSVSSRSVSE